MTFYRCLSYNCQNDKCDRAADEPIHPGTWVFVVVGLGIVICMFDSVILMSWPDPVLSDRRYNGIAVVRASSNAPREPSQIGAILQ